MIPQTILIGLAFLIPPLNVAPNTNAVLADTSGSAANIKVGMGSLSKEMIRHVVRKNQPKLRICYESELSKNPAFSSRVNAKWSIDKDGTTHKISVIARENPNEAFEGCIANQIGTWQFPKPIGGGVVKVTYPFVFEPSEADGLFSENPIVYGPLDKTVVKKVVQQRRVQFRACYEKALVEQAALKGKITVKFVVKASGDILKANLKDSELNHPAMEQCILREFQALKFPSHNKGGIVVVHHPLSFNRSVLETNNSQQQNAAEKESAELVVYGSLEKDVIRKVVNKHSSAIKKCYTKTLAKNQALKGTVSMKWVISSSGDVVKASVVKSDLQNSTLENCLTQKVKSMRFPNPTEGGIVVVTYPFLFAP